MQLARLSELLFMSSVQTQEEIGPIASTSIAIGQATAIAFSQAGMNVAKAIGVHETFDRFKSVPIVKQDPPPRLMRWIWQT